MPIPIDRLTRAATQLRPDVVKSFREAKAAGMRTGFLCHSHEDQTLASGLVVLFANEGWDVYVDWRDPSMPSSPTRETARRIQDKIRQADFFLFLATSNSVRSRWCPWEIGYADGTRPTESILIVPTESNGTIHGNEYLDLYRRIDFSNRGQLAAWPAGQTTGGTILSSL